MNNNEKIFVTKPFLPQIDEYKKYIDTIYANGTLTNQGPLVLDLERKLKDYLAVSNFHYVSNGTIALMLSLKALGITEGEIITTPFSYVATTSSILWERCVPVFVDIEPDNYTIDADKIERAITKNTKAILAVHVFGYACAVNKIEKIARKHGLKVVYDGAHAFGVRYAGKSLLSYGDVSTLSFHATKLFHTVEGGACLTQSEEISERLELIKRFGHNFDDHMMLGINGKNSEFHAAMGLAVFPYISGLIAERKRLSEIYDQELGQSVERPKAQKDLTYNYAYYPVVFKDEEELKAVFAALSQEGIFPRRYFYPPLNTLPYLTAREVCLISESISKRIACLPLFFGLEEDSVRRICKVVKAALADHL